MSLNSEIQYKGFSYLPIIKISNELVDGDDKWYEYLIEGRKGKRKCLVKGAGLYNSPEQASNAANKFAKTRIDEHLYKYEKSFLYRMICNFGYCPASKYNQQSSYRDNS